MGINGYVAANATAQAIIDKASQHNLSGSLVPALSKSGDIVLGVVVETQIDAFNLGAIFGDTGMYGPCSVDSWGITQIFSYSNAAIARIGKGMGSCPAQPNT